MRPDRSHYSSGFAHPWQPSVQVTVLAMWGVLAAAGGCGSSSSVSVAPTSIQRCGVTVTGGTSAVPAGGGSGTLTVNAERECSWSARSESSWISLNATSGQGPATITYSVQANPNASTRRTGVAIEEQRVEISQEAAPCRYQVSPSAAEVAAAGGAPAFGITAPGGCNWNVQTAAPWVSGEPGSGQGSATVRLTAVANPGAARDATVTVAGVSVALHQAGTTTPPPPPPPPTQTCVPRLDPSSFNAQIDSDTIKIEVRVEKNCKWVSSSPVSWVTIKEGRTGSGNDDVQIKIEENEGPPRSTTLIIAGLPFSLTQAGKNR